MAIHCGINLMTLERLKKQNYRYGGLVSKGGSYLTAWMLHNKRENPLYEKIDRVAETLKKYDVVLSLGNGFRAGAVGDSTDRVQLQVKSLRNSEGAGCTMCGKFCASDILKGLFTSYMEGTGKK